MNNPSVLDYTGRSLVAARSTEIPGVIELTIHTPTTVASALMDAYALMELRNIIQKALERSNNK